MREMKQDRIALDRAAVSARTMDEGSGHMHVAQTNISKAAINPYLGSEIPGADELGLDPNKVYNLFRHPDELAKAAKSFDGKPLVMMHRAQSADDGDHQNRIGTVHNPVFDAPFLKADLAIWTSEAIDAIESGEQRELSCGYHYVPVMTPGTYEGVEYQGLMTELAGNHVALVKEGRAGADCHVFDSIEGLNMTTTLTPKGAVAQGALIAYLKPKLAKDAKIDLRPMLKGVSVNTWKTDKARLAADIKRQVKGKLAKDADVEDVMELLDALEEVVPEMEVEKLASVENVDDPDSPAIDEDETVAAIRAKLKAKGMTDEEIDEICGKPTADDGVDPDEMEGSSAVVSATGGESTAPKTPIEGEDRRIGKDKNVVTRTAMDAALRRAVETATRAATDRVNAIYKAKEDVAPWVGKLPGAFDSVEGVYRAALAARDIDTKGVHPDALKHILEVQPKPGDRPRNVPAHVAMDAASRGEYETMFPDANRLAN